MDRPAAAEGLTSPSPGSRGHILSHHKPGSGLLGPGQLEAITGVGPGPACNYDEPAPIARTHPSRDKANPAARAMLKADSSRGSTKPWAEPSPGKRPAAALSPGAAIRARGARQEGLNIPPPDKLQGTCLPATLSNPSDLQPQRRSSLSGR